MKFLHIYCAIFLIPTSFLPNSYAVETVVADRISTGVIVQHLFMDPSGKFACIFGQKPQTQHVRSSIYSPPKELIVIDLKKRDVVARVPTAGWVQAATVNDKQILWAPKETNVLKRLRFDGTGEPDKVALNGSGVEIFGLGPNSFGIVTLSERNRGTIAVHSRKTLQESETHTLSGMPISWTRGKASVVHLGSSQLHVRERVIDESSGDILCYCIKGRQPPQIGDVRKEISFPSYKYFGNAIWRRNINRSEVVQFSGDARIQFSADYAWISQTHPLLATLHKSRGDNHLTSFLDVEFQDLVHGQVLDRIRLPEPVRVVSGKLTRQRALRVGGDTVLVTLWSDVFITNIPEKHLGDQVMQPLQLTYPKVPVVDVGRPFSFQLSALGGKPPYRFDLAEKIPGVTVSEKTGKVTVNHSIRWNTLIKLIESNKHPYYHGSRSGAHNKNMRTCEYLGINDIDGKILVSIPAQFVVSDQSGQRDRIFISLLAWASLDDYEDAGKAQKNSKQNSLWKWLGF